jgi:hypothetical protein
LFVFILYSCVVEYLKNILVGVIFSAVPQIIATDMDDREIYESLYTAYEIRATGIPRPEAKWWVNAQLFD